MKFLENLKMKKLRKGQKGFTLIELLVVIAILGVIAAVAVPNILSFMDKGETEAAAAELHNVVVAVSAVMYDGADPSTDGSEQITVANVPLVRAYLISDTSWAYTIDDQGNVVQGAKVA